jgi:hypothetical protein
VSASLAVVFDAFQDEFLLSSVEVPCLELTDDDAAVLAASDAGLPITRHYETCHICDVASVQGGLVLLQHLMSYRHCESPPSL